MTVRLTEKSPSELLSIDGVQVYVDQAGVKKADRDDLTLIVLNSQNTIGAVFTQNHFYAAPVYIVKSHLFDEGGVRVLVINTGNTSTDMDAQGRTDAVEVCEAATRQVGCKPSQILPFSAGAMPEPLLVQRVIDTLPNVKPVHWSDTARTIITTDTVSKAASREGKVGERHTIRAIGIIKGSGMAHPNMATMLTSIATGTKVSQPALQLLTREIADATFDTITVGGDTSTNDSSIIMAMGKCGQMEIDNTADPRYGQLKELLGSIALELAQAIVHDGGGTGKLITVRVKRAADREETRKVAYAVARSPLIETTLSVSDLSLGHLLATIGYAGIAGLDVDRIRMWLGDMLVTEHGGRAESHTEEQGQAMMDEDEITVHIDLQRGKAEATVYACDLAHGYISINAGYRS